jgi:hypothetical protein
MSLSRNPFAPQLNNNNNNNNADTGSASHAIVIGPFSLLLSQIMISLLYFAHNVLRFQASFAVLAWFTVAGNE